MHFGSPAAPSANPAGTTRQAQRKSPSVSRGEGPLPPHYVSACQKASTPTGPCVREISSLFERVDPLAYPSIHVEGTLGYSTASKGRTPAGNAQNISMARFGARGIMQRRPASSPVVELPHAAGRLPQQYLADAGANIEDQRLSRVVRNQDKLRLESL